MTEEFPKIKHLVISGGGGTGFAYYSVLRESNKEGFWNIDNIETIHGVSVGTFFAFCMAVLKHVGWDTYDDYLIKRPWENEISAAKLFNAYNNVGICGREFIENFFSPILKSIDLPLNITLLEFYEFTKIEIHYYTTNLDSYEYVDLSHKTHPNWTLIDAVYSSCAIPVFFRPNRIDGVVYVDGAFLCNYPLKQCIEIAGSPDEIFGINKIGIISTDEPSTLTPDYGNIVDYLLDIITKTVKKLTLEKPKSKYTMEISDKITSAWEIYNAIKSKESRLSRIQHGVKSWNEFKKQIGFVPLNI